MSKFPLLFWLIARLRKLKTCLRIIFFLSRGHYFSRCFGAFIVTGEDLQRYIAPLKNLKTLRLVGQPEITDKGILHLTGLEKLKSWTFKKTDKISKKGIQVFRKKIAQTKPLKKK
ncbi:hypothetical protein MNBD_PLANCTO02-957 [hydrothermal vent metagenome]|uniref:Uncharacterized protein n=1 Tax=hydrothermal vent metagenome TaxID=652676 RepID=A0A3B1DVY9_9ZZZZ